MSEIMRRVKQLAAWIPLLSFVQGLIYLQVKFQRCPPPQSVGLIRVESVNKAVLLFYFFY